MSSRSVGLPRKRGISQRPFMTLLSTDIPDVKTVEPRVFGDTRGLFHESFSARQFH
jgi:dTDP-4-dehydrorhamnose 3,5-epimerase-like enzyme